MMNGNYIPVGGISVANKSITRNPGLDVIRCGALLLIHVAHFFDGIGFYDRLVCGSWMYLGTILRCTSMACVPLFLLLSGYLMNRKMPCKNHYKGLLKTLVLYLLVSITYILYRWIRSLVMGDEVFVLTDRLLRILSFSNTGYEWYIEMYIGLYLIVPYLNLIYHNLDSRESKRRLVLTFFLITSLPYMTNIFRFDSWQWWLHPASNASYQQLLPDFWTQAFPITFYFTGAYLSEFPLKLKRSRCIPALLGTILIYGTFCFYRSYNQQYVDGCWSWSFAPVVLFIAVLIFHLFSGLDYSRLHPWAAKLFSKIATFSLGAYLVSRIYDEIVYGLIARYVPVFHHRLLLLPIAVAVVGCCSLLTAAVLHRISTALLASINARKETSVQ